MAPRVLISYAHEPGVREKVVDLGTSLRKAGVDARIDRYESDNLNWTNWMEREVKAADFILCVCTELYLRRWEGERVGGGVEYEATLIRVVSRRGAEKAVPLFFEPLPDNHLKLVPTALANDPIVLSQPKFKRDRPPHDARSLLLKLYALAEVPLPELAPPMSPEELRSDHPSAPTEREADPDLAAAVHRESRAELVHALQIDRDQQWNSLVARSGADKLLVCLHGSRENALHLFSRRMASDFRRWLDAPLRHIPIRYPARGHERPPTRPGDWRRVTRDALQTLDAKLDRALEVVSRDSHVNLFFGPIPQRGLENEAVVGGLKGFLEHDLAPALNDLAEARRQRRVWLIFCVEYDRRSFEPTPPWTELAKWLAERTGTELLVLPEVTLPDWERDIEVFLSRNGVPMKRWSDAHELYRKVIGGAEDLEALFETLDQMVDDAGRR